MSDSTFNSDIKLDDINELSPTILRVLEEQFNFTQFTQIQSKSFQPIIKGGDVLIKAATGSGKTLAFALPALIHLLKLKVERNGINRKDGTNILVLAPTRELAIQIQDVFDRLFRVFPFLVAGVIFGGNRTRMEDSKKSSKNAEKNRLKKGVNILVATTGSLIHHLNNTASLISSLENLDMMIVDEADQFFDDRGIDDFKTIFHKLKEIKQRKYNREGILQLPTRFFQTVLASATLSKKTQDLANFLLVDPVFIQTEEQDAVVIKEKEFKVPQTLNQNVCFVPTKLRPVALVSMLRWIHPLDENNRTIVFFSSKREVDFFTHVFSKVKKPTPLVFKPKGNNQLKEKISFLEKMKKANTEENKENEDDVNFVDQMIPGTILALHGDMDQLDRIEVYRQFMKDSNTILFCTDVAARGLDFAGVNWTIQYSLPHDVETYFHRAGRTARIGNEGSTMLFAHPHEHKYVENLRGGYGLSIREMKIGILLTRLYKDLGVGRNPDSCSAVVQKEFVTFVDNDAQSLALAMDAFDSALKAYSITCNNNREVLNWKDLHLGHFCKSFFLQATPKQLGGRYRYEQEKLEEEKKKNDLVFRKKRKESRKQIYSSQRTGTEMDQVWKRPENNFKRTPRMK
eukprot:TRINITY_DN7102_c0_g1_i1.p1 TRINITY_DN7102_c0_g1~~TRINITY_DN7102_c0_g1_i1.p1  ORF type:complete len:641 (+),score=180.67 TRINITY_DN7102_c0_g1_i1:42-1925(+)